MVAEDCDDAGGRSGLSSRRWCLAPGGQRRAGRIAKKSGIQSRTTLRSCYEPRRASGLLHREAEAVGGPDRTRIQGRLVVYSCQFQFVGAARPGKSMNICLTTLAIAGCGFFIASSLSLPSATPVQISFFWRASTTSMLAVPTL